MAAQHEHIENIEASKTGNYDTTQSAMPILVAHKKLDTAKQSGSVT